MNEGNALLFLIQPSSGVPIYRQIIDQVQRLIASGALEPGDELPSIREMASTFEINQMTISKAYSLLEAQGILIRNRGKRMVISDDAAIDQSVRQRMKLLRPVLHEVVTQARQLAIPVEEVFQELEHMLEMEGQDE